MKLSSKPISSPGRTEKYPPPLMGFLRSNVGSRSRGRFRSSPMFVRKKNTSIETQEPSSPEVTCMGQVHVKRSKQTGSKPGGPGASTRRHSCCKWVRNALFCHHFPGKVVAKPFFRPSWKQWWAIFHMGSSSLACRFWGSPLFNRETNEETEEIELEDRGLNEEGDPTSEKESICRNSDEGPQMDSETEEKQGFSKELEEEKKEKSENNEELKTEQFEKVRPLILTRCKSEPARTAERLDPELSFWKNRRVLSAFGSRAVLGGFMAL
ncbi:uncharacterized protein LOC111297827 [Durio zibethinus]|uniref:Uncharacterized protein LOC111297827 n=1 Tax=Durio zibethinus TaxID=66656 RepID=A0A6P5Z5X9_DURZI|nr:uncharacterized protein LOC111297827 [Durio zibethinus]